MHIEDLRREIDHIDDELIRLFLKRMDIARQVAEYKKENNLPIYVPAREREKLQDVAAKAGADMEDYIRSLYSLIFEISRNYQTKCNNDEGGEIPQD